MPKFLTFDLGTTLYKVALFDEDGTLLALERAKPPIRSPHPNWAEVEAGDFLRVLVEATQSLRAQVGGLDDVIAVSFATQANSFTLLDERGEPIMPFILWSDQRALPMSEELAKIPTSLPRFGPLLALSKLYWLQRHRPESLRGAFRMCFLSDYLAAAPFTEASIAGLSGALDLRTLRWNGKTLNRVRPPSIRMPAVCRAGDRLGRFARAAQFGLPVDCQMIFGCLDQYAGAIGTGTVEPGNVCETTGTVLAAVRCSDRLEGRRPDVFQGPAFERGRFWQMSFSSTSANLLEWYRSSLAHSPSFEELSRLAGEADDAVTIEPYRDGEPIGSCFRHVKPAHSVGQVVRGIMRCVAEALKRQVSSLSSTPESIRCAGGAAKSDVWLQIKADTLRTTVEAVDCAEPTSLGAAMLVAQTLGLGSLAELAQRWVRVRRVFRPGR